MDILRIKNHKDKYFNEAWSLYESAFPPEEKRTLEDQVKLFSKENFHFDIILDNYEFIGFLLWWDFEEYRFIDHFATSPNQRNKGYGKKIIEEFIQRSAQPIILEVELPSTELNQRRINFYERLGFIVNKHYYEAPAMQESHAPYQLYLMSYPSIISEEQVSDFINEAHPQMVL